MVVGFRSDAVAVCGNVVCCLEVERFFDFGVGGDGEVEEDEGREDQDEDSV